MAELNPPMWLESEAHPSDGMRRLLGWSHAPGVFEGLGVTEKAAPDMGVTVGVGSGVVAGDESASQGVYFCETDADEDLVIAVSDATHPRKDRIVMLVEDSYYSGATDAWSLSVVTGTPATPALEPDLPDNALELALVDVGAGVTSILNADITNRRVWTEGGRQETIVYTSGGTFTKADYPWARRYRVRVVGSGGGGAGAGITGASEVSGGGGGGGGGYAERSGRVAALDAAVTVTVGAAGAGGNGAAGAAGAASSFGTLAVASGGAGGGYTAPTATVPRQQTGGTSGDGSAGTVTGRGEAGGTALLLGYLTGQCVGGPGGSSVLSGGVRGASSAGTDATGYGAGGGGSANRQNQAAALTGGAGAGGVVILDLYA